SPIIDGQARERLRQARRPSRGSRGARSAGTKPDTESPLAALKNSTAQKLRQLGDIRRDPPRLWTASGLSGAIQTCLVIRLSYSLPPRLANRGSVNFAVSFYTGWPHSLDSEGRRKLPNPSPNSSGTYTRSNTLYRPAL